MSAREIKQQILNAVEHKLTMIETGLTAESQARHEAFSNLYNKLVQFEPLTADDLALITEVISHYYQE